MTRYGAWLIGTSSSHLRRSPRTMPSIWPWTRGSGRGWRSTFFPLALGRCLRSSLAVSPREPADDSVRLADGGDLVYTGYNDAIGYGEFVRVDRGQLVRQFLQDKQDPSADVNVGTLPEEAEQRFDRWPDVAKWVDEDEEFTVSDRGLWIHRVAG